MDDLLFESGEKRDAGVVPVTAVEAEGMAALVRSLSGTHAGWVRANGFEAGEGQSLLLPGAKGNVERVLFGLGPEKKRANRDPFLPGQLSTSLPEGDYALDGDVSDPRLAALAWALNGYKFTRYRSQKPAAARLALPDGVDGYELRLIADGARLARDLINTPAEDMGPDELEAEVRKLARFHKAKVKVIKGKSLLDKDFP